MNHSDVLIVGGGPVGLHLACRMVSAGFSVQVLEKRLRPSQHSRSIGIHPPALETLEDIGAARNLIAAGIPVREGRAVSGSSVLGSVTFEKCPPPFDFVLSIPQHMTERILDLRLRELAPDSYLRGVEVDQVTVYPEGVEARTIDGRRFRASYLVGCDGSHSLVRRSVGIEFRGKTYRDWFVMGDFVDTTDLGPTAVIFLPSRGLVESFPLPGGLRRWVVRVSSRQEEASPEHVAALVAARTNHHLEPGTCQTASAFGVQRILASTMAQGRVLLAGDAAHVVSPIGGQGMNLGWLDSREAATALSVALVSPMDRQAAFRRYSASRLSAARRAANRAEFNMIFGRPSALMGIKRLGVRLMLLPFARDVFARRFTMRGL